jgi:hypothetical protein
VIVLCLNDGPLGVYSTVELADDAALVDWQKREPRWKQLGLSLGQSCIDNGYTDRPIRFIKYYYHQHGFVVDAEAVS